jgi:hypothetical protein
MPPTVDVTPGSADANSYVTVEEAQAYFDGRIAIPEWTDSEVKDALVIMATTVIDNMFSGVKVVNKDVDPPFMWVLPRWTGVPTDAAVQALAWPRIGMVNRNGAPIPPDVIPRDLKRATAELAGQLARTDLTIDNDVAVQGIKSVSAGSVSVAFRDAGIATTRMIPDAVMMMLVPSWYTDEGQLYMSTVDFEVL